MTVDIFSRSGLLSLNYIKFLNWKSLVLIDFPNLHQLYFITESIKKFCSGRKIIFRLEDQSRNKILSEELGDIDYQNYSVVPIEFRKISGMPFVFTDSNIFAFNEGYDSEFVILAGTPEFLKSCIPYPKEILDTENRWRILEMHEKAQEYMRPICNAYHMDWSNDDSNLE